MPAFKSHKEYSSRLARQEARKFTSQALGFSLLAIAIIALVLFVGIPALVKLAIFIGELNSASAPVAQKNIIPPAAPQLLPLPEATNSATIRLEGYAEPGTMVNIYVNGNKVKESLIDESGSFNFPDITIIDGNNSIYAEANDSAGNTSPPSSSLTINMYPDKPNLSVNFPVNGQQFFGVANQQITIEGKTDVKNYITINDRQVVVLSDGSFKHRLQLTEGDTTIQIK
jgi:hypothetical protein